MGLEDKTEKRKIGSKEVTVVVKRLTEAEAREMFPYRPASKYAESRFGGNNLYDDVALMLHGDAHRCPMCQSPTKDEYLKPACPDCDGRSEFNGVDPRNKDTSLPSHLASHSSPIEYEDGEAD